MSYRLQKPFQGTEKEDFIVAYNHAMGLSITEGTDTYEQGDLTLKGDFLFALLPNEMMAEVEVEIDVPDEEEYTETLTEQLLDANGEVVLDENNEPVISTTEITKVRQLETTHKETVTVYKPIINPDYEQEELARLKPLKYEENNQKADAKRYSQEFTITIQEQECVFDTTEKTQTDLLTAFAVCSTGATYDGWVTNNGIEIDLTLEDVALISATFKELSNVYPKWNEYKTLIDNAETLEELNAIVIDYEA